MRVCCVCVCVCVCVWQGTRTHTNTHTHTSPPSAAPWLLRLEMDALMMVDKKLEMDAIEAKIKDEFAVRGGGVIWT